MLQRETLLQIVQSTLSSMDSDAVNHIGETQESEQIALLAKEVFIELATYQRIPQFEELSQLEGLSDSNQPTVMRIPKGSTDIVDVRYRHLLAGQEEPFFREVEFLHKSDFLDMQLRLPLRGVGEEEHGFNILDSGIEVPYITTRGPRYWTTFDNEHVVFDAIDIRCDATMHQDQSLVLAYVIPEFLLEDTFVPPIPLKLISQYRNMIKELASFEQKQLSNQFRTRNAERQRYKNRSFGGINDGADEGEYTSRQRPDQGRVLLRGTRGNRTSRFGRNFSSRRFI